MTFYHGTSDKCNIDKFILPPILTGILRESFRKDMHDYVFLATSLKSAEAYAKKACKKFGGRQVIYRVKPDGDCFYKGNGDYICYRAIVLGRTLIVEIKL